MADLQKDLPAFTLLTDLKGEVSGAWGLMIPGGDHPSPGTFVVDRDGRVTWRFLENNGKDWPTYDQVAAALQ